MVQKEEKKKTSEADFESKSTKKNTEAKAKSARKTTAKKTNKEAETGAPKRKQKEKYKVIEKSAIKKKTEKAAVKKLEKKKEAAAAEVKPPSAKAKSAPVKPKPAKTKAKPAQAKAKPEKAKAKKDAKQKEYIPGLQLKYKDEIIQEMMKSFNYKNAFEVPKLVKITLNVGMGEALQNSKLLEAAVDDLAVITGQRPIITRAKRSVSNFKLREGNPIGCKVTLRSERMYEFLERFIAIAIPRVRDFRGLSDSSFDGFGNYNVGVKEQIIFPEIDYDKVESIHGMDVNIVTTAETDEEANVLLRLFGVPFAETAEVAAIA